MLGRLLVCAIAMVGAWPAAHAAAGERTSYRPHADALALLMQDARATAGEALAAIPIGYDMAAPRAAVAPTHPDLAGFEQFDAAVAALARDVSAAPSWRVAEGSERATESSRRSALGEASATRPRPVRRRTLLNASVVLRLDGAEESPSLSLGGSAAVLNLLPRR